MKNYLNKILVATIILGTTHQLHAYIYSFSNHTNKTIAVGMKYKGAGYTEFIVVKPNERQSFRPGDIEIPGVKSEISWAKNWHVPSQWLYLVNPPFMSSENQETVMWRAFQITWIPSESYDIALELSEAIGKTAAIAARAGMKAAAAYMSGGTSEIAEQAKNAIMKAQEDEGVNVKVSNNDYGLGTLLRVIGKAAGRSMMASCHIDIIEDENGKISFISLL